MIRQLLPFTLVVSLFVARPAWADTPARTNDPAAEKQRGDRAMDGLHFDEALEAYTHAYELGHDPAVLYNRGRLRQARSEYARALEDLETFERDAPPELKARVPKLAQLLEELRAQVATVAVHSNVPGANVVLRGVSVGATPLEDLRVNAGDARIEITAPGYAPWTSTVVLPGGKTSTLDAPLVARDTLGTLVVTVNGPRATILVDGEPIGVAPVEVLRSPGNHRVVVKRDASDDVTTSAILVAGARKEIHFDAPPKKPITSHWWFWTGIGVAAAAIAVTAILVAQTEKSPADGEGFSPTRVSGPLRVQW